MSEKPSGVDLKAIHAFQVVPGETYVTVRRGTRWNEYPTGTIVGLVLQDPANRDENYVYVGLGTIERRFTTPFNLLQARDIEKEHEVSSRLYSGLLDSMRRAYGKEFTQDEIVTVVYYSVEEFDAEGQAEFMAAHGIDQPVDEDPIVFTAGDKRELFGDMPTDELVEADKLRRHAEAIERADRMEGTPLETDAPPTSATVNPVLEGQAERAQALGHAIQGEAAKVFGSAPADEAPVPETPTWTPSPSAPPVTPPVTDENFGC